MAPREGSELIDLQCDFLRRRPAGAQVSYGSKSPLPGMIISNEAYFVSIAPDERIVTASTMKSDGWIFSASLVMFELLPSSKLRI